MSISASLHEASTRRRRGAISPIAAEAVHISDVGSARCRVRRPCNRPWAAGTSNSPSSLPISSGTLAHGRAVPGSSRRQFERSLDWHLPV